MDQFGVQRGAHVYWPFHRVCRRFAWSPACAACCGKLLYIRLYVAPVRTQLQPAADSAGARGTYFRNFLSSDTYLCAAKYSIAVSAVYVGALRDIRGRSGEHCPVALRLVSGTPFLRLDVLEFSSHHARHDRLHFLRHPCRAPQKEQRTATELHRVSLWQCGICHDVCGARPRAAIGLVALRLVQRTFLRGALFSGMRAGAPVAGSESVG